VGITTEILTDGDPLDAILAGAEKLYKAVSTTMGPRGGNVIFRKYGRKVGVTHDGVTVAKLVRDDDEAKDVAIDVIREAAMKLDATTGDGTTTVVVLTYHILKEAITQIKQDENPMKLRLALDALQQTILDQINQHTDKDITEKKLIDVASVSSGSKLIGEEVGKIIFQAGADTPIMLGFSDSSTTYSEVIDGFKIDAGAASPYLMQGAGVKLELVEPYVIVVDAKLRDKEDILPILRIIASLPEAERNILLVTSDIAGDAMNYLVMNHLKGFARIACARVPEHIQAHSEYLSDVAVACGANVLSRNSGNTIKEPNLDQFGRADKVTVEPRETVIIGGKRIAEDFEERIASLKDFAESYKTKMGRKFADDRLKTLEQKVVSIFVGGQSETDAEERHYRYEDAVGASRAALRGGIVPGGGSLLGGIASVIERTNDNSVASRILVTALTSLRAKIYDNAGILPTQLSGWGEGYDVMHPEDGVIDLVERGIVDPAESEIECVKTAITVAGLLMTSGAMIIDRGAPDEQASTTPNFN